MKKIFTVIIAAAMIIALPAPAKAQSFQSTAKAAILIDAASGHVIYEKNADEQLACAGVAKTMSMLLFFEAEKTAGCRLAIQCPSANMQHPWAAHRCFWIPIPHIL